MPTICFAYTTGSYSDIAPDPVADPIFDRFMRERGDIYARLRTQGFDVVISVDGKESFERAVNQTYVRGFTANDAALPGHPIRLPVKGLDIIVNRTSKILELADARTMVNDAATYRYGNNKLKTYQDILAPNSLGIITLPVNNLADLDVALDQFGQGHVVLKKVMGSLSEGLHIVDPPTARRLAQTDEVGAQVSYIVQPRYDFTIPWPAEIVALGNAEHSRGELLREPHRPKELRVYIFLNPQPNRELQIVCYPAARIDNSNAEHMTPAGSNYLAVAPETVPRELYEGSEAAMRTLARITKSRAIYGCFDWGYGARHGSQAPPGWVIVEANLCGPRLLEADGFPQVGPILHSHYVDFLRRAATTA